MREALCKKCFEFSKCAFISHLWLQRKKIWQERILSKNRRWIRHQLVDKYMTVWYVTRQHTALQKNWWVLLCWYKYVWLNAHIYIMFLRLWHQLFKVLYYSYGYWGLSLSQASLCWICGGQNGTGTGLSPTISGFPCHYPPNHSLTYHQCYVILTVDIVWHTHTWDILQEVHCNDINYASSPSVYYTTQYQ